MVVILVVVVVLMLNGEKLSSLEKRKSTKTEQVPVREILCLQIY